MKRMFQFGPVVCIILLSSCATKPEPTTGVSATELPADVSVSKEAGNRHIVINLKLETGEEVPFIVDTGAPGTLLPKTLEPILGKRITTQTIWMENRKAKSDVYAAPRLYLGNTRLMTGSRMATWGDSMGLLGMDCLRYYCIQLDFEAGKLRFLDPEHVEISALDKAFPLLLPEHDVTFIRHGTLIERENSKAVVDTGCNMLDGMLRPGLLRREIREQKGEAIPLVWVEGNAVKRTDYVGLARFQESVWNGQTYTNLLIGKGVNLIALRFLARHQQVTFNFPKRTMYLKQLPNTNWTDILNYYEHGPQRN